MRRPGAHEELTDPENEKVLGTLTPEAWRGLSVEAVAAKWYANQVAVARASQEWHPLNPWRVEEVSGLPARPEQRENPLASLIHEARQSSGSIRGEHRKDLKDAIIGAPQQTVGLSVPVQEPVKAEAGQPKRGF